MSEKEKIKAIREATGYGMMLIKTFIRLYPDVEPSKENLSLFFKSERLKGHII